MRKSRISTTPIGPASIKSSLRVSTISNNTPQQANSNLALDNSKTDTSQQILNDSQIQKETKPSINRLPPSISGSLSLSVKNPKINKVKTSLNGSQNKAKESSVGKNSQNSEHSNMKGSFSKDITLQNEKKENGSQVDKNEFHTFKPKSPIKPKKHEFNHKISSDVLLKSPNSFISGSNSSSKKKSPSFFNAQITSTDKKKNTTQLLIAENQTASLNTSKIPDISIAPLSNDEEKVAKQISLLQGKTSRERSNGNSKKGSADLALGLGKQSSSPGKSNDSLDSLLLEEVEEASNQYQYLQIFPSPKSDISPGSSVHFNHNRTKSKFSTKKTVDPQIQKEILDESGFSARVREAATTPQSNELHVQKMRSHKLAIEKFRGLIDNFSQQSTANSILKQIEDVERSIFQENSKKMKIEKKLRSADEENLKLRGMINYLLNCEFQQI